MKNVNSLELVSQHHCACFRVQESTAGRVILGKKKLFVPDMKLQELFTHQPEPTRFHKFYRLPTRQGVFFSRQYERVKCRNSFSVIFEVETEKKYGLIDYFLELVNDLFAVVTMLKSSHVWLSLMT